MRTDMRPEDAIPAELVSLWEERGIEVGALEERADGTLAATRVADEDGDPDPLHSDALESAQRSLREGAVQSIDQALLLEEVLGTGGFGVVRKGQQIALRREVAVKHLKPKSDPSRAGASLLKEAWVGGALSHPNVIPVHTLLHHEGRPAIVMRRIDGLSLREVIEEEEARRRLKIEDPIEWYLRVMMQVCNAVHFAHRHGVLHLDLKPDNVMIGRFGEVYVLDWGLAAGCGPERPEWLPPASEIRRVIGTPSYLAPEQASGQGEAMGPHTDVYLLGATLHGCLLGEGPHRRAPLPTMLRDAYLSPPYAYGPEVPEELAGILRRAMHRHPAERYPSAEALREALEGFLKHRESVALVGSAEAKLKELRALDAEEEPPPQALQAAFVEARFALAQARRSWPENPRVDPLLHEILELMFENAMRKGLIMLAESHLESMRAPPATLRERLERAKREQAQEAARVAALDAMREELDLRVSRSSRIRYVVGMGVFWVLGNLACAALERSGLHTISYLDLALIAALILVIYLPLVWLNRSVLLRNRINLRMWVITVSVFFFSEGNFLAGAVWGMPIKGVLSTTPFYLSILFVALGAFSNRGAFLAIPSMAGAGLACMLFPDYVFELLALGGIPSAFAMVRAEREGAREDAARGLEPLDPERDPGPPG